MQDAVVSKCLIPSHDGTIHPESLGRILGNDCLCRCANVIGHRAGNLTVQDPTEAHNSAPCSEQMVGTKLGLLLKVLFGTLHHIIWSLNKFKGDA